MISQKIEAPAESAQETSAQEAPAQEEEPSSGSEEKLSDGEKKPQA